LDDLRTAHVLMHVVDVSGTTDANGKATKGYDPTQDIDWLHQEIHRSVLDIYILELFLFNNNSWIFNNLWKRWPGIVRRHVATS
jgi:hypothetical protein